VNYPIKIAITGKIGSGKSTVSDLIKNLGYSVFESDKEVNKLFNNNSIKKKIKVLFSDKINNLFKKNGLINKIHLGNFVFSNKKGLKNLEDLVHPLLNKEKERFINSKKKEKVIFFDIPLLFEKKLFSKYDFIIYLYVKKQIQKERVLKRKKMNEDKLEKILDAQDYNLKDYSKLISIKIDTSKSLHQTKEKLTTFINKKVLNL